MGEYKKFTTAEIVLGSLLTFFIDVLAALLDFLPIVGNILATMIQAATSGLTTYWLWTKGGEKATRLERQGIKQISNVLPWVPTCFAAFVIEIILHNSPEKFGKLGEIASGQSESKVAGTIGKSDNIKKAA